MIYVIQIGKGKYVKIGFTESRDLAERIAMLQTGNPFQIKPVAFVDGTIQQEKSLHAALRAALCRLRLESPPNEWYMGRHPFMEQVIRGLREGGVNHAIAFADTFSQNVRQPGKGRSSLEPLIAWPALK